MSSDVLWCIVVGTVGMGAVPLYWSIWQVTHHDW